jgi:CDP-glycerol glycerophosphotransferase
VTDYPDMNELLQITDILISDYSSAIGDFALSGKMCLLYQDDIEEYTKGDRGLIFNLSESPFLRCSTPDELYKLLSNYNNIDIQANCRAINRFYGSYEDGTASIKISDIIYNKVYAH